MHLKHITLTLLASFFYLSGFALQPQSLAPLWEHLMEVNVQWEQQIENPADFHHQVQFDNDTERIQTHLSLVASILRNREHPELTATQRSQRLHHLDVLERYADAAQFPINNGHLERTPYFIDGKGTACAVGYLLLEDGQDELVAQIKTEMNNAYLLDMPYEELPLWAEKNGFTLKELAWIQPGYPINDPSWGALTSAPNGPVTFIYEDKINNQVILTGSFSQVGSLAVTNLAVYDGSSVSTLGNGIDGVVFDALRMGNKLYFAGTFNQGQHNLMVWDGTAFSAHSILLGPIFDLIEYDGQLVMAGAMSSGGIPTPENIRIGDENNSVLLGAGFDGDVHSLEIHNGELYAGGNFLNSGNTATAYIARYDGTAWQAVGGGLPSQVNDLLSADGELYAAGDIYKEGQPFVRDYGIAHLTSGSWTTLLDSTFVHEASGEGEINELRYQDGQVYASGHFNVVSFFDIGRDLGYLNLSTGALFPIVYPNGPIKAFGFYGQQLVIGGTFTYLSPSVVSYAAEKNIPLAVTPPAEDLQLLAYPNPSSSSIRVIWPYVGDDVLQSVEAWDVSGKRAKLKWAWKGPEVTLYRGGLPAGRYFVRFVGKEGVLGTAKLVFQ